MLKNYICINLLNFPHNVEDILNELQTDANILNQQTVSEWLKLVCARNLWTEDEIRQQIGASIAQYEEMKVSQKLPSKQLKQQFMLLLIE